MLEPRRDITRRGSSIRQGLALVVPYTLVVSDVSDVNQEFDRHGHSSSTVARTGGCSLRRRCARLHDGGGSSGLEPQGNVRGPVRAET
jgi:hypothetical protein